MRLELRSVNVERMEFGNTTTVAGGRLTIAREALAALLAADARLSEVELEIAHPGEDCRISGIFDIFEPRYKPDGRMNFPGLSDPLGRAGNGTTVALRGAAVTVIGGLPERSAPLVDMTGPGTAICPYAKLAHLCIRSKPAAGVSKAAYYRALKEAGARAATYLAEVAATVAPDAVEIYERAAKGAGLPRVAYVFTVASQQRPTEADEPIVYGDNVRHPLPTVLDPNEVMDGAVIAPYWNFGGETYLIQNHPMINELYRRHSVDLDFAGVISIIAAENEAERKRNAIVTSTLAHEVLRADGVVMTKYGGGIPESVLMETLDACEELGVQGALVVWTHGGDGRIEGSLTFMSPRANAVASCGINDEFMTLPKPARVIGMEKIGPVLTAQGSVVFDAREEVRVSYQLIAGAINQYGGTRLSVEEY